jgi:hypothetical protein
LFRDGLKPEDQGLTIENIYTCQYSCNLALSLGAGAGATNNTIKTRSTGRLFFSSSAFGIIALKGFHFYYQTGRKQ